MELKFIQFLKQLHFRRDDVITTITPKGVLQRILRNNPIPCYAAPSHVKRRKSKKKGTSPVFPVYILYHIAD